MPFDISELPKITKRTLRDDKMVFTLNTETNEILITVVMEDEYDTNGKKSIHTLRPKAVIRNMIGGEMAFTIAFEQLLPDDDEVTWTNPRKTLMTKIMELFKEAITK